MPDFGKVAEAFGLKFFRISKNSEVDKVINKVYNTEGPLICEVILDEKQGFEPKLASKKLEDGSMYSPPLEDMFPFLDRAELEENMRISKEKE